MTRHISISHIYKKFATRHNFLPFLSVLMEYLRLVTFFLTKQAYRQGSFWTSGLF